MSIRLGISTCPNDTFAFQALAHGDSDRHGLTFDLDYLDVQELNERMAAGAYDVAKVSFHAAVAHAADWVVLPSGSALGFGVGPLVLGAPARRRPDGPPAPPLVLCPGEWTTATLLWKLFHPEPARLRQVVFSDIMPALEAGRADLGVCIHEGRFVWRERGLERIEDLGETWERETGVPLPLGGIVGRRTLGDDVLHHVQAAIRSSLEWALAHRDDTLGFMRGHAQEQSDEVIWQHVDLYVNEWTRDLGDEGRTALSTLSRLARARGLLAPGETLTVL